jgi:16S rRNA (cytidine1402-2'-O)-methyltransferase
MNNNQPFNLRKIGRMFGILYIIATPIGNLEDITLRALRLLREVDIIAAEDTRVTRKLLSHFDIHTPLISYHLHSRVNKEEEILHMLEDGKSVALVSDAGMPGISDPGEQLIRSALNRGIPVCPIPGANAALCALVASGLPTSRFVFEGFPPRARSDREAFMKDIAAEHRTIILYESPRRLLSTLKELKEKNGGASEVAVARELTKVYEEVFRGCLSEAVEFFQLKEPRGEFVIVLKKSFQVNDNKDSDDWKEVLKDMLASGYKPSDAVRVVVYSFAINRRDAYTYVVDLSLERKNK